MDNTTEEDQLIDNKEAWEGNNYFPCQGKILYGPCGFRPTLITATSILVPVCLFIGANSEYMTTDLNVAIPIIVAVLTVITLSFLIIAAFSDPGMILRRPLKGQIELCRRPVLINQAGYLRTYRYCGTCTIIRPNRSTHCGDCNNCVERFDHHCPWIGNCAGRRNYVYFYTFLVLLNILTVFMGVFCIIHIALYVPKMVKDALPPTISIEARSIEAYALGECIISLFVLIYCALSMLFTTGLLIYHTRLISHNITTKEELKKFFTNPFGNPFERAFGMNWKSVLCPKLRKMSILDYFNSCKINKNIVMTEEKKALKETNREVVMLEDKEVNKALEKSIEPQLSKRQFKTLNGGNNNSDNTSIADKKNDDYFRRESRVSHQSEIQGKNLQKKSSDLSEKYSNCSENLSTGSNAKNIIPSFHCQIDFQHSNDTRENINMNSAHQENTSSPDSNSQIGRQSTIKGKKKAKFDEERGVE